MFFSVFYNKNNNKAVEKYSIFTEILKSLDIEYETEQISKKTDMIVSIGGDGTVLKTARISKETNLPILCINTGSLGFLGIDTSDIKDLLKKIIDGKYDIDERIMVSAGVNGKVYHALNDIVIKNGETARVIEIDLEIDGNCIYRLKGDGVIVSTPTGSTAYSLAAGGPVVIPELRDLIVTPLNPHSLNSRPVIIGEKKLIVRSGEISQEIIMAVDGQEHIKLKSPFAVEISVSDKSARFIKNEKNFFEVLIQKLGWR